MGRPRGHCLTCGDKSFILAVGPCSNQYCSDTEATHCGGQLDKLYYDNFNSGILDWNHISGDSHFSFEGGAAINDSGIAKIYTSFNEVDGKYGIRDLIDGEGYLNYRYLDISTKVTFYKDGNNYAGIWIGDGIGIIVKNNIFPEEIHLVRVNNNGNITEEIAWPSGNPYKIGSGPIFGETSEVCFPGSLFASPDKPGQTRAGVIEGHYNQDLNNCGRIGLILGDLRTAEGLPGHFQSKGHWYTLYYQPFPMDRDRCLLAIPITLYQSGYIGKCASAWHKPFFTEDFRLPDNLRIGLFSDGPARFDDVCLRFGTTETENIKPPDVPVRFIPESTFKFYVTAIGDPSGFFCEEPFCHEYMGGCAEAINFSFDGEKWTGSTTLSQCGGKRLSMDFVFGEHSLIEDDEDEFATGNLLINIDDHIIPTFHGGGDTKGTGTLTGSETEIFWRKLCFLGGATSINFSFCPIPNLDYHVNIQGLFLRQENDDLVCNEVHFGGGHLTMSISGLVIPDRKCNASCGHINPVFAASGPAEGTVGECSGLQQFFGPNDNSSEFYVPIHDFPTDVNSATNRVCGFGCSPGTPAIDRVRLEPSGNQWFLSFEFHALFCLGTNAFFYTSLGHVSGVPPITHECCPLNLEYIHSFPTTGLMPDCTGLDERALLETHPFINFSFIFTEPEIPC